jgi:hypothetical protein
LDVDEKAMLVSMETSLRYSHPKPQDSQVRGTHVVCTERFLHIHQLHGRHALGLEASRNTAYVLCLQAAGLLSHAAQTPVVGRTYPRLYHHLSWCSLRMPLG